MAYSLTSFDAKVTSTREWLTNEYQSLRTGRAAPMLLDAIHVDAYGSRMPLKQVANVSIEDARTLRVTPFDRGLLKDIERSIVSANLGVGTVTQDAFIRITFPELTGERRAELIKVAKQKLEEARVTIKNARHDITSDIDVQEKDGTITEDEKFRVKEELQKKVDAANKALEEIFKKKEEEMNS
jgi:ribosome recycling factor